MLKITNFKLGLGIPNNFPMLYTAFFDTFIQLYKPDCVYLPARFGSIDDMRNKIVQMAMREGCSHLFMTDTDQKLTDREMIFKMLSHNQPVVHCRVFRRYPPFDSLMFEKDIVTGGFREKTGYKNGSLVEVDICGAGCVLYSMEVFYKIDYPWFETKYSESGDKNGEDTVFCRKLRKAGYRIYVDTSIKISHLGVMEIDESFSILYNSLMKRQKELTPETKLFDK